MKAKKLALLGIGANYTDVFDAVQARNTLYPTYEIVGYFGKPRTEAKIARLGIPCLGGVEEAVRLPAEVLVAGIFSGVGHYFKAEEHKDREGLPAERYATIVHPAASVPPQTELGYGAIILAGAVLGADVKIGNWVLILQNATLSHDCVVEDFSCITAAAAFVGGVKIGRSCYIGTNATIINGVQIGEQSLIGAGALIRHDVPPREIWVGNPGRKLDTLDNWLKRKAVKA